VIGNPADIAPETMVHRVDGGTVGNLRLSALDEKLTPPGISVLLGGTPQAAAEQLRAAFPRSRKWGQGKRTVGTATAAAIRAAGFEVVPDATARFSNHAPVIHPEGTEGFTNGNLAKLASAFRDTSGC
jgi:anthranilate phosphoribosyltransferase